MIPEWNMSGVLPPIRPGLSGDHVDRSPYVTSLLEFVNRFATSAPRIEIIDGLLKYRKELHSSGIKKGFQWLDGSFMEKIESLEARQPVDIDVVSFFYLPDGKSQQEKRRSKRHHIAGLSRGDMTVRVPLATGCNGDKNDSSG